MKTIYQRVYDKLEQLAGDLRAIPETKKSQVPGFMDLNLDRLSPNGSVTVIALSHYYKHPSGDMIPDPDMEIRVMPSERTAEALSYQDSYTYRPVYGEQGGVVSTAAKQELNEFLEQWLSNCLEQGHRLA
jgi:uncharacterized protein YqiB (DUF1249 family)